MSKEKTNGTRSPAAVVLFISVLCGIALTIVLLFACAFAVCFTALGEGIIPIAALAATVIGILASGYIAAAKRNSRGWLWGGISGVLYAAVLFIISVFGGNASFVKGVICAAAAFVCGSTGGIFGINMSNK